MANTRSSQGSNPQSSPPSSKKAGTKRKADEGAAEEATEPKPTKQQKTLEETLPATNGKDDDTKTRKGEEDVNGSAKANGHVDHDGGQGEEPKKTDEEAQVTAQHSESGKESSEKNAFDQVKADDTDAGATSKVRAMEVLTYL